MPILTLAYLKCFECHNKWIEFQDRVSTPRSACPSCESVVTSEPVFISHIRRAVEVLEEEYLNQEIDDEAYADRAAYLRGMYLDAVPVILKRLGQILTLAIGDLEQGNMSDSVISRLYLADFGFLELGMPLAAAICSGIIAASLGTRHYDGRFSNDSEELQRLSRTTEGPFAGRSLPHFQILLRLMDLTRAVEWAQHLGLPRWEAMFRILSAVATLRDAAALPPAAAEPLCVMSWHQLQLAISLARQNMYFYLLPTLEHRAQEACRLLREVPEAPPSLLGPTSGPSAAERPGPPGRLPEEAGLMAWGQELAERLERDLMEPGRASVLQGLTADVARGQTRIGLLGPSLLPLDDREEALPQLASLLEGMDREFLQRALSAERIDLDFYKQHVERFRQAFVQYFNLYGDWIRKAQSGGILQSQVNWVMIHGFRIQGSPELVYEVRSAVLQNGGR